MSLMKSIHAKYRRLKRHAVLELFGPKTPLGLSPLEMPSKTQYTIVYEKGNKCIIIQGGRGIKTGLMFDVFRPAKTKMQSKHLPVVHVRGTAPVKPAIIPTKKLPMPDDGDMPSIHESIPGPHVVTRPSATGETVAIKHVSPGNLFPYDTVTLHVSTTKPTTVVVGQTIRNSDSSTSITTENVGVPEQQYDVAHAFPGMTPTGTALHLLPGTHEIPLTVKNQKAVDTRFVEHTAKSLLDDHSIERPSGNHETHPDSPLGAAITKFGITAEARTEQSVPKLVFDPLETQNALHVALNSHKELPFAVMAHPALSDPPYFTVKYKDVPFVHSNDLPEEAFHVEKQLRVAHVDDIAQLTPANATANIKGQAVVAPSPPLSRRMGNRHTKDEEDDEESSSRSRRRQTKNDDEEEEEEGSSSRRRARSKRDDSEERKPSRKPSRRDAEWA